MSSRATTYTFKDIQKLLKMWPKDPNNVTKDLGEVLRQRVAVAFPRGEASPTLTQEGAITPKEFKIWFSLANNELNQKYPRRFPNASSFMLTREQATVAATSRFMDEFSKYLDEQTWFDRLKSQFGSR